ncbi:MAG: helix-turn-helix domain-containing protein [Bacteroidetes bacterium]|nr:helix-turn-helix domain-containing protein [Bacteroidota bacterium]
MTVSFLTNLDEKEFKEFLKQALREVLNEGITKPAESLPEILDIKQAAKYLRLKLTTLYEKTSRKLIPHFKKGNRLYFQLADLQSWIREGKVKTAEQISGDAATYALTAKKNQY